MDGNGGSPNFKAGVVAKADHLFDLTLSICKLCAGIIFASFARFPKREILSVTSKPRVGLYCDDPIVFNDAYECLLHFSKNDVICNQNPAIFVFVCNFSVLIWSKRFTENLRCWPGPNCFGV